MIRKTTLIIFTVSLLMYIYGDKPEVSNILVDTSSHRIIEIQYDVYNSLEKPMEIEVYLSSDGGESYTQRLSSLSGDLSEVQSGTGKVIEWDAYQELGPVEGENFRIKIVAYSHPVERYDIVVNGGSLGAVASALQAARDNADAEILLLEPTDWLGGQATSQGVSAIDNAYTTHMVDTPEYYAKDWLEFQELVKNKTQDAPGTGFAGTGACWVSRFSYDPRTGAWALEEMINQKPNITLKKMTVVKDVSTMPVFDEYGEGREITGLQIIQRSPQPGYTPFNRFLSEEIPDWYSVQDSDYFTKDVHVILPRDSEKGMVVIEGSEFGDILVLAEAKYTVGREMETEEMGEDGQLPELNERGTQSFVFTFCVTGSGEFDEGEDIKAPFPDFDAYYQQQVEDYFSLGTHSWERVWTYRRVLNAGAPWQMDTVNKDDVSMQNWYPGNDYPYGTLYKNIEESRQEKDDWQGGVMLDQIAQAEKHALAYYFYYRDIKPEEMPFDIYLLRRDDELNMMDTYSGLSKKPYFRGTRRIVGLNNFRITERFYNTRPDASFFYYDSIGIGNYPTDIHPNHEYDFGITPTILYPEPFYIPYRSLGSQNVRNLLASGKNYATTFLTNSGYRLHPIEWAAGVGSGAAAALMTQHAVTNYDLLQTELLRELQANVKKNSPISWPVQDESGKPVITGDVVINNFEMPSPGEPFLIEVYHYGSAEVKAFYQGGELESSTKRFNDRFIIEDNVIFEPLQWVRIKCYDENGNYIESLTVKPNGESLMEEGAFLLVDHSNMVIKGKEAEIMVYHPQAMSVALYVNEVQIAENSSAESGVFEFSYIFEKTGEFQVAAHCYDADNQLIEILEVTVISFADDTFVLVNRGEDVPVDTPFTIKVFHPDAHSAYIIAEDQWDRGETYNRKGNYLLWKDPGFNTPGERWIAAYCYDEHGNEIDRLIGEFTVFEE